ncbi:MAG: hypothetical protein AAF591_11540 [Verrucomicrobiota bacterium]
MHLRSLPSLAFLALSIPTIAFTQPKPTEHRNTKPADRDRQLQALEYQQKGYQNFFAAKIDKSLDDFDAFLAVFPERKPHHWQRGISLYYAGRFAEGKEQFELHQTVNPQDVENAVWHFICSAKTPEFGIEHAREHFISITQDPRIPMKQIHALFAGNGTPEEVLDAANHAPLSRRPNALCYAHLYLGLYYEALDEPEKSLHHIKKAALEFTQSHYMGEVARVHLHLRTAKNAR